MAAPTQAPTMTDFNEYGASIGGGLIVGASIVGGSIGGAGIKTFN
jgi:hypothetical protein